MTEQTAPSKRERIAPIPLSEKAIGIAARDPSKGPVIYRFADQNGLALRVTPNGRKFFIYCYTSDATDTNGKRKQERVATGIEWQKRTGAIERAKKWMDERDRKPENRRARARRERAEKQVAAKEITVDRLIDRYLHEYARPNKRSWKEDESRLKGHVLPAWGERKAKDISRADVDELVSEVALGNPERGIPARRAEANHRLAVIRKMFSFAVDKGIIEHHPCLRMSAPGGKIEARIRALTTAKELRLLWRLTDPNGPWTKAKREGWPRDIPWESRGRMSRTIADALRLVLGTGCRANEATGLTWDELNLDAAEWLLPAIRSKNKRPHLMPLLPEVVAMLRQRRSEVRGDHVFPGQRRGTAHLNDSHLSGALGNACRRLARIGLAPFVTHDLRRTVETGMAAAKVPKEYRDRVLNHVDSSVGGKHYNVHDYSDEKREALDKWARRLEGMLRPRAGNVVEMRRGSA